MIQSMESVRTYFSVYFYERLKFCNARNPVKSATIHARAKKTQGIEGAISCVGFNELYGAPKISE
jgi:hypothetical protein